MEDLSFGVKLYLVSPRHLRQINIFLFAILNALTETKTIGFVSHHFLNKTTKLDLVTLNWNLSFPCLHILSLTT